MPSENQTSLIRRVFESELSRIIAIIVTVMGFMNYVVVPINEMRQDITYIKQEISGHLTETAEIIAARDAEQKVQDQRISVLERVVDVIKDRLGIEARILDAAAKTP